MFLGFNILGEIFAYFFKSNNWGSRIPSSKMVHAGWMFVVGIRPSRTWMSGSSESMWDNATVHRLDLSLYSHPKEFWGNGVRTMLTPWEYPVYWQNSPEEDWTRRTASSRTASPTHYQQAILAPHSVAFLNHRQRAGRDWHLQIFADSQRHASLKFCFRLCLALCFGSYVCSICKMSPHAPTDKPLPTFVPGKGEKKTTPQTQPRKQQQKPNNKHTQNLTHLNMLVCAWCV